MGSIRAIGARLRRVFEHFLQFLRDYMTSCRKPPKRVSGRNELRKAPFELPRAEKAIPDRDGRVCACLDSSNGALRVENVLLGAFSGTRVPLFLKNRLRAARGRRPRPPSPTAAPYRTAPAPLRGGREGEEEKEQKGSGALRAGQCLAESPHDCCAIVCVRALLHSCRRALRGDSSNYSLEYSSKYCTVTSVFLLHFLIETRARVAHRVASSRARLSVFSVSFRPFLRSKHLRS